MKKENIIWALLIITCSLVSAQKNDSIPTKKKKNKWWLSNNDSTSNTDYYATPNLFYTNYVYKKNIKTVQLFETSFEQLSAPIIQLGSGQQLQLNFDDIEGGLKTFNYTVIHCNANWEPSDLSQQEYLNAMLSDLIRDYSYSINTLQHFTHYKAVFPNENISITKTGNYILKVYEDNNPDKLVLSRRFMVFDQKVNVDAFVRAPTINEYRRFKQEIDFNINYNNYTIQNPYSDIKVAVLQNGRWDNAKTNLKPLFLKDNQLVYDYDQDNVFDGCNEFRYFDIKTLRLQTERIARIEYDSTLNKVYLLPDEKRTYKRYLVYQDINGKYLIKNQEGRTSDRDGDYAWVYFTLPTNAPVEGQVYVFGALTDWEFKPEAKMIYNEEKFCYETKLYLKQGYYNYEYMVVKDGSTIGDDAELEGMHWETENDYTILVYHRAMGTLYDQLIGIKQTNLLTGNR